jgi:Mg-chelatase subunit ChlD
MKSAALFLLALAASASFCAASDPEAASARNLVIIADSSRSMAAQASEGLSRHEAVKAAIGALVRELPDNMNVALMAFGHIETAKGQEERSVETIVPLGPINPAAIESALRSLKMVGKSPLAASIEKAATLIRGAVGRSCILLVTDGRETCGGDPIETARAIREKQNIGVVIDIVSLQADKEAEAHLAAIAEAGGGRYFNAEDPGAIKMTIEKTIRGRITTKDNPGLPETALPARKTDSGGGAVEVGNPSAPTGSGGGLGLLVVNYETLMPQSIAIYPQKGNDKVGGSSMWMHLEKSYKTSLKPGIYRLEIRAAGKSEPVEIKNVVIDSNRETSVQLE